MVELLVASAVLMVTLAITASVVVAITRQSGADVSLGQSTESAQTALSGIAQYVRGAVAPVAAYGARGQAQATWGTDPPATSDLCWDSSANSDVQGVPSPAPYPQSRAIGADPGGAVPAPPPYSANVIDPEGLAVVYAHDYALELCTYLPNSTTPVVVEAYVDPASCSRVSWTCSVEVVKFPSFTGPVPGNTEDYAPSAPANAPGAVVVGQVRNVWCDAACQGLGEGAGGGTLSPTTGSWSCWSYAASGTSAPSGDCAGGTAATTPPLFTYVGGATGGNPTTQPYDLFCSPASGPNPNQCAPTISGSSSTDDTVNLASAGFSEVEIRMTVVGDAQQASSGTGSSAARVAVQQIVPLTNLAAEAQG